MRSGRSRVGEDHRRGPLAPFINERLIPDVLNPFSEDPVQAGEARDEVLIEHGPPRRDEHSPAAPLGHIGIGVAVSEVGAEHIAEAEQLEAAPPPHLCPPSQDALEDKQAESGLCDRWVVVRPPAAPLEGARLGHDVAVGHLRLG